MAEGKKLLPFQQGRELSQQMMVMTDSLQGPHPQHLATEVVPVTEGQNLIPDLGPLTLQT